MFICENSSGCIVCTLSRTDLLETIITIKTEMVVHGKEPKDIHKALRKVIKQKIG